MEADRNENWPGLVLGGLGPLVVAGLMVAVRDQVAAATTVLVLVLAVVLAAVVGGRSAGALAAVVAALSFDFFHTQPYLSLTIDSADDIETMCILLVVGLVVGQVALRSRTRRAAVDRGSAEVARIHRVAELVAQGEPMADVLLAAQTEVTELLGLASCRFEALGEGAPLPVMGRTGAVSGVSYRTMGRHGLELPPEGVALPVLSRGFDVGRLVLVPIPGRGASLEERTVAVAVADQLGAAMSAPSPVAPVPGRRAPSGEAG